MANTQDPQNEQQDAAKNAPAEAENASEIIMQAVLAALNGAPDADSKIERATGLLDHSHAERLVKAAQATTIGEPDAESELHWVIKQLLSRDCDEIIAQAQANAGTPELAAKIRETTRVVAINAFHRHGPDKDVQNFTLVAVPLMLTLPYSEYTEVPHALSQEETDWLVQAFAAQGLIDPVHEQMQLAPQLWRADEIHNFSYSKVWSLAQAFSHAMTDKTVLDPEEILAQQVAPQEIAPGRVNICLRYVIGAFVHPYGIEPSAFGKADTEAKLEAWQDEAAKYLDRRYHCQAAVCSPDSLYLALESGWFWCHLKLLASQFAEALRHYRLLPREITTVISLHAIEDGVCQLHIGYTRYTESGKPELLGGSIWPIAPFEDPNETADSIQQALENNGIAAVEIASDIQAGFNGKAGMPFLLPTQQAAPDPGGLMPAPTHLQ